MTIETNYGTVNNNDTYALAIPESNTRTCTRCGERKDVAGIAGFCGLITLLGTVIAGSYWAHMAVYNKTHTGNAYTAEAIHCAKVATEVLGFVTLGSGVGLFFSPSEYVKGCSVGAEIVAVLTKK